MSFNNIAYLLVKVNVKLRISLIYSQYKYMHYRALLYLVVFIVITMNLISRGKRITYSYLLIYKEDNTGQNKKAGFNYCNEADYKV
jgi:hypothetical protein